MFFRRLSQAQNTQTDALLGAMDPSTSQGKIILRPLSVQERIRELNFRARHFADTMLAIQGNGGPPIGRHGPHTMGPRSLQVSDLDNLALTCKSSSILIGFLCNAVLSVEFPKDP